MSQNFSDFTNAAPTLSGNVVGYSTPTSGGERRFTWRSVWDLFNSSPTIITPTINTITAGAGQPLTLATATANANVVIAPASNGIISSSADLVLSNNPLAIGWAGDPSRLGRGLYIQRDGPAANGSPTLSALRSGDNTRGPAFDGWFSDGTLTAPTATANGSQCAFRMVTYDGASWIIPTAQMVFSTTEAHTPTARGTSVRFFTTPTGSNVSITAWQIDGLGNAIINQNAGNTLVGTTSTSGLIGPGNLKVANSIVCVSVSGGDWRGNVVPIAYGGTNLTTYALGDIVYASATNVLGRLAAVAANSVLVSTGVGSAPQWSNTLNVSTLGFTNLVGVVPVTNGGTGANTASGGFDALSGAETIVASNATTNIGAVTSNKLSITGNVNISSLGTVGAGVERSGVFANVLTIVHNSTSLILPGAANITTAANDTFRAVSLGSGNWRIYDYTPYSGRPVVSGGYLLDPIVQGAATYVAGNTYYFGWNYGLAASTNIGRYKIYIPKTGTIKSIQYTYHSSAGGDSGHSLTVDVLLNGSTSVGAVTIQSNLTDSAPVATGLSQSVTAWNGSTGDYVEGRTVAPAGMTSTSNSMLKIVVVIE